MARKKKKVTVIDNPNEKEILDASSYSLGKAIWERFSRHKLAVIGLVIFVLLFVFTMLAPVIEVMTGYQFNYTSLHMKAKPGSFPGIAVSITDPDWDNLEVYPKDFWFTEYDTSTGMATLNMDTFDNPEYKDFYSYTVKSYGYEEELEVEKEQAFDSRGRPIEVESDGPPVYKEFFIGKSHTKLVTQTGQKIEFNPPFDELDEKVISTGKYAGEKREQDLGEAKRHLLGTDNSGHDVLPRLAYGGRVSLTIGFAVTVITGFLGIFFGSIGGYFGGFADALLMRTIELMGTIPTLPLYMVLTASLPGGNSVFVIILIFSVFGWAGNARMTRGQFLAERSKEYTEAAKAIGAGNMRIIFKHVLPNSVAPVITQLSMRVGSTVLSESSLSFLGLGVNPITTPTWGALISEANAYFLEYPWPGLFAGFLIFLVVVSFFFLGDGLRDALDPRQKI